MFREAFFSTVQFVFAGNDSEGLRYGTVGTPEKMFLKWKEPTHNERFKALMRTFLPEWEDRRRELNALPVRHEDWDY